MKTDPLRAFRAPLVTVIALILGFIIGFLADWIIDDDFLAFDTIDFVLFIGIIICAFLMMISLWRILIINYTEETANQYYTKTLKVFFGGLILLFLTMIICCLIAA